MYCAFPTTLCCTRWPHTHTHTVHNPHVVPAFSPTPLGAGFRTAAAPPLQLLVPSGRGGRAARVQERARACKSNVQVLALARVQGPSACTRHASEVAPRRRARLFARVQGVLHGLLHSHRALARVQAACKRVVSYKFSKLPKVSFSRCQACKSLHVLVILLHAQKAWI